MPAFRFRRGRGADTLADLPPVEVPFGLHLNRARVTDASLKALARLDNLTSLNLASLLQDAQQILVLRRGAGPPGSGGGESSGAGGKINLNTATLDQLESLPGIGEVLGQRILDYREQHGPFHSVEDLLNVSGIGPSHLAEVKDLVAV